MGKRLCHLRRGSETPYGLSDEIVLAMRRFDRVHVIRKRVPFPSQGYGRTHVPALFLAFHFLRFDFFIVIYRGVFGRPFKLSNAFA